MLKPINTTLKSHWGMMRISQYLLLISLVTQPLLARDSLLVTITLDKHEFLVDEPIWCEFRLTNVGDTPIACSNYLRDQLSYSIFDSKTGMQYREQSFIFYSSDYWMSYHDSIPVIMPGESRFFVREIQSTINQVLIDQVRNPAPAHLGKFRIEAQFDDTFYRRVYGKQQVLKLGPWAPGDTSHTRKFNDLSKKYFTVKNFIAAEPDSFTITQPTGVDSIVHLLLLENIKEYYTDYKDNYPKKTRIFMEFIEACPHSPYTLVGFDYLMRANGGYRLKHMTFDPIQYLIKQNNLSIFPWLGFIGNNMPVDPLPPDLDESHQKVARLEAFKSQITNPRVQAYIDDLIARRFVSGQPPASKYIPVDHPPPD